MWWYTIDHIVMVAELMGSRVLLNIDNLLKSRF